MSSPIGGFLCTVYDGEKHLSVLDLAPKIFFGKDVARSTAPRTLHYGRIRVGSVTDFADVHFLLLEPPSYPFPFIFEVYMWHEDYVRCNEFRTLFLNEFPIPVHTKLRPDNEQGIWPVLD